MNISLWRFPLCNPLKHYLLICLPIRENLSHFYPDPGCLGNERQFVFRGAHTHSHIQFHCADAEEARPAVSAFPWAKLLCRCLRKHGDENKELLWSKHLLCYFSSIVAAAHMVLVPAVNHRICRYRWMHFPYQAGFKRQTLLAEVSLQQLSYTWWVFLSS